MVLCLSCENEATFKCTKCLNILYCSKECQIKDHPRHQFEDKANFKDRINFKNFLQITQEICPVLNFRHTRNLNKGFGLFARDDIPAGFLLFEEAPIWKADCIKFEPQEAYDSMSKEEKEKTWSLCYNPIHKPQTSSEKDRYVSIITQNAIYTHSNDQNANPDEIALFHIICRMNHSCVPSTTMWFDHERNIARVVTARDIKKGEELTLYVLYCKLYNYEDRGKLILQKYTSLCLCKLCTSTDISKSDAVIQKCLYFLKQLSDKTTAGDLFKNTKANPKALKTLYKDCRSIVDGVYKITGCESAPFSHLNIIFHESFAINLYIFLTDMRKIVMHEKMLPFYLIAIEFTKKSISFYIALTGKRNNKITDALYCILKSYDFYKNRAP